MLEDLRDGQTISRFPGLCSPQPVTVQVQGICFAVSTSCVLSAVRKAESACSNAIVNTPAKQTCPQYTVLTWAFSRGSGVLLFCVWLILFWPTVLCPSALMWLYLSLNCRWPCFSVYIEAHPHSPIHTLENLIFFMASQALCVYE